MYGVFRKLCHDLGEVEEFVTIQKQEKKFKFKFFYKKQFLRDVIYERPLGRKTEKDLIYTWNLATK